MHGPVEFVGSKMASNPVWCIFPCFRWDFYIFYPAEFGFGLELWLFLLIVPMAISPPSSHMSSSGNKSQLFQRQKYSLTEMCFEPNATTKSVAVSNACLNRKLCFRSLRIWERRGNQNA